MGIEEAQELSEALDGITPAYLLCLDDTSPLSQEEWQLLQRYRKTDDRGRFVILQVAESQGHRELDSTVVDDPVATS